MLGLHIRIRQTAYIACGAKCDSIFLKTVFCTYDQMSALIVLGSVLMAVAVSAILPPFFMCP